MMIKQILTVGALILAYDASALCLTDAPELGDMGPSSERVCVALEQRFPGANLAVENRVVHSPTDVTVLVRVDGKGDTIRYELSGLRWLDATESGASQGRAEEGLSAR